ncbi:MAG: hypothetical protein D6790_17280, partial [Caldilineae bacterium]
FVYHGWGKITNPGGGAMMGLSSTVWLVVGLLEAGGGLLVLAGGFLPDLVTRIGGVMLVIPMLGAISMVHWGRWSFVPSETHPMGGMEFQVTLLLLALFFALVGNTVGSAARE